MDFEHSQQYGVVWTLDPSSLIDEGDLAHGVKGRWSKEGLYIISKSRIVYVSTLNR